MKLKDCCSNFKANALNLRWENQLQVSYTSCSCQVIDTPSYITCRTDIIRFIFYVVATNDSDCGFKVDPCPADKTFDHTLFSD